tara:strand:- start:275 stop:499 length:225 start_codon:yes stop_codon:yes gene_type:complete
MEGKRPRYPSDVRDRRAEHKARRERQKNELTNLKEENLALKAQIKKLEHLCNYQVVIAENENLKRKLYKDVNDG